MSKYPGILGTHNVVMKALAAHSRPVFDIPGVKLACVCGWQSDGDSTSRHPNKRRFRNHQAWAVAIALTEHAKQAELEVAE